MPKQYRPSSASEYDSFYARLCAKCAKDIEGDCPIILNAMLFDTDTPEYPDAWVLLEMAGNFDDNRYYATCMEFEALTS